MSSENFHAEIEMHKNQKSIKNIDVVKRERRSLRKLSNGNDIITFKIWLFDYEEYKMKTDEFPF